jgi:lipopolysaccharide heptosyltransferase II
MIGAIEPRADLRRAALAGLGWLAGPALSRIGGRQKVLVIRPDHLGDLLFLTPALQRLRHGLPDAELVGLIGSWGVPVLVRNPQLDRIITWDFPWFDRKPARSAIARYTSLVRLAARLRAEKFDLAIQFRADFWWGALAVRLAGVPEHLGYAAPTVRPFLTQSVPIQHGRHAADENLALAEIVAGPGGGERLEFPVTEAERGVAEGLLSRVGAERPLVALQTGAGAPVKLWPTERLAQLGRALRDRCGAQIVAIGGAAEHALVDAVADGIGPETIRLAGATSLGELAAVLERCALAVGPDSGPLHLAVAVGTPTVHLFGPADPRRFGPYGDPTWHRVVQSPWPCCPCNRLDFSGAALAAHRCMAELPADSVIQEAMDLLDRSLRRRG